MPRVELAYFKALSSVLPQADTKATVPGDVYKLEQFMPEIGNELLQELQEEAVEFFRQSGSVQKIVNFGENF